MISFNKITELFCITDSFCKNFEKTTASFIIGNTPKRKPKMSTSEVITIYYLFYLGGFVVLSIFTFFMSKNICNKIFQIQFLITDSLNCCNLPFYQ